MVSECDAFILPEVGVIYSTRGHEEHTHDPAHDHT